MAEKQYIKCFNCGTTNLNQDYCQNCGELIDSELRRKLELEKQEAERRAKELEKEPSKISVFFAKAENHPNKIIGTLAKTVSSVWFLALALIIFIIMIIVIIAI